MIDNNTQKETLKDKDETFQEEFGVSAYYEEIDWTAQEGITYQNYGPDTIKKVESKHLNNNEQEFDTSAFDQTLEANPIDFNNSKNDKPQIHNQKSTNRNRLT